MIKGKLGMRCKSSDRQLKKRGKEGSRMQTNKEDDQNQLPTHRIYFILKSLTLSRTVLFS